MGEMDKIVDALVERVADRVVELLEARGARGGAAPPDALMQKQDVCQVLGVSPASLDRFCREGMPHVYVGASRRFRRAAVVAWFESRPRGGARPAPVDVDRASVQLRTRRA